MFGFCKSDSSIPIAHLDYKYIGECLDAKELEKLLRILRSGDEGHYPDLIKFTEKRLEKTNPQSKLLQKENKIKSIKDIEKDEGTSLMEDLQEWTSKMAHVDKEIIETTDQEKSSKEYPPIRTPASVKQPKMDSESDGRFENGAKKRAAPRSYTEWDKFDVEKEAKNVDEMINKKSTDSTRIQNISKPVSSNVQIPSDAPEDEVAIKANLEKSKGNEAFKSGDFNEALAYYNRSIFLKKSPALFNNRAITYINLERYQNAIDDCNTVLKEEPDNIKAFLRRGIALKSLKRHKQALVDFETVLQIAPTNKRAQSLADEMKKTLKDIGNDAGISESILNGKEPKRQATGKGPLISEVHSNGLDAKKDEKKDKQPAKKGKRLKIVEVESTEEIDNSSVNSNGNLDDVEQKNGGKSLPEGPRISCISTGKSIDDNVNTASVSCEGKTVAVANQDRTVAVANQDRTVAVANQDRTVAVTSQPRTVLPIPENVLALKNEGNAFFKNGRYVDAEEKYSEAIQLLSKDSKGHEASIAVLLSNRAACKLKIGDCKGCVKDAAESLKMSPTAKALLRRATAYETIENYRQAYVDYQGALSIDKNLQAAWSGTSRLANLLKNRDGVRWRENLPRSESYANIYQFGSMIANGDKEKNHVSNVDENFSRDVPLPENTTEPLKEEISREALEEKFKKIKEKGNQFVQKKMFEDAVSCYTECIELLPDEVACYTNRSLCYLKLEKPEDAEVDASKAIDLQNDNIKALFRRASARKTLLRYEDAIDDLTRLLSIDQSNMAAKKELESIKKLLKETPKTQRSKGSHAATSDTSNKSRTGPGVNDRSKNTTEIKQNGSNLVEEIENTRKDMNADVNKTTKKKGKKLKIVEVEELDDINKFSNEKNQDKDNINSNVVTMEKEAEKENIENEANIENVPLGYSFFDEPLEEEIPDDVIELINKGQDLIRKGKYADAIGYYTEAINSICSESKRYTKSLAMLYNNRAACKSKIGNCKGCIEDATESLKLDVTPKAYVNRAMAFESLEKYRNAYVDNLSALRIDSSVKSAWDACTRLIGVLRDQDGPRWRDKLPKPDDLSQLGQPDEGKQEKHLEEKHAEPISPNEVKGTQQAESPDHVDDDQGNTIKSTKSELKEEKFKKVKELGNNCVQEGRYQEAANFYSQCIDLLPDEVISFTNRALCYLKLSKPKKAEIDCTKALSLQPENIKAMFRRALARKASGKYKESLQDLTGLLKLDSQNNAARKEIEVVKDLWREELKRLSSKMPEKSKDLSGQQKSKKGKKIEEISSKTGGTQKVEGCANQNDASQSKTTPKETIQRSPRKLHLKKASGFEFLKAWNELKGRSLKEHADLLSQIEPAQLPKVISNKIDGEMILTIVSCVQEFFMSKDKLLHGFNILRYIGKAERFNMGIMFLSTSDLSKVRKVVEDVEGKIKDSNVRVTAKEMSELKKAYKVT